MTKPLHDACYHQAKEKFDVYPSARANQWVAKCRKKKGIIRKTKAGESLKRWGKEEWKDEKGRPCGSGKKGETVKWVIQNGDIHLLTMEVHFTISNILFQIMYQTPII